MASILFFVSHARSDLLEFFERVVSAKVIKQILLVGLSLPLLHQFGAGVRVVHREFL